MGELSRLSEISGIFVCNKMKIGMQWFLISLGIQSPCQMMIGVYNHLLSKVFRFQYHSQKVIGSLGYWQVKKNSKDVFTKLLRLFRGWGFPYIGRIHTAYIGFHTSILRYLKCLVMCELGCIYNVDISVQH